MKQTPNEIRRNLNPTPEAVFAMFHWPARLKADRDALRTQVRHD